MAMNPIVKRLPPLRIKHPFTAKNAVIISAASGIILTGMMMIDNLKFRQESPDPTRETFDPNQLLFTLAHETLLAFVLFLFCFYIFRNTSDSKNNDTHNNGSLLGLNPSVAAIGGAMIIGFLFSMGSHWVHTQLFPTLGIRNMFDVSMIKDGFVVLTVLLITLMLYNITHRQQVELETEHLQAENLQNRYKSLVNQIDPHFLFNSLNTLDTLIETDEERAHEYLQQLAQSYRYIMQQQQIVTLGEELEFLNNYIAMMRLRFGNTLTVIQEIDSAFSGYKIIPISIQLLVENAIKHNIVSERHPLTITIKTTPESTLIVSNPLQPKCDTLYEGNPNTEEHTGIGLVNLEQRYQLMFHRGIIINHTENLFSVEIPLAAQ